MRAVVSEQKFIVVVKFQRQDCVTKTVSIYDDCNGLVVARFIVIGRFALAGALPLETLQFCRRYKNIATYSHQQIALIIFLDSTASWTTCTLIHCKRTYFQLQLQAEKSYNLLQAELTVAAWFIPIA